MVSCRSSESELIFHIVINATETERGTVEAPRRAGTPAPRTIERAFSVLDSFTVEASRWRTSDLARHCALPVPTVHRILGVLESFGYLRRDPRTREYQLGPSAANLGRRQPAARELRRLAEPVLRAVRSAAGERVLLAAPNRSRDRGVEIADLRRDSDAEPEPPIGRTGPLHAGAAFKALLAYMDGTEVDSLLAHGLERVGPATIAKPAMLHADLEAIRRRGWAFSREEVRAGLWAVAVPVIDGSGAVPCALAITTPVERLDLDLARRQLTILGRAARTLRERLAEVQEAEMELDERAWAA